MGTAAARAAATVDDVLITAELGRRPARAPDHAAESRALVELATAMAESPRGVFQKLADTALALCRAGSAGVSVWEPDGPADVFRWQATAGDYAPYLGGTMPRGFSPCGAVLDRNATQLMADPVRFYPYIADLCSPVREVLLVPFHQAGAAVGTVWVVAHSADQHFDAEDARLVTSLTRFAGAAVQTLNRIEAAERAEAARQDAQTRLEATLAAGEVATWTWDVAADRVVADRNLARMFAVSDADARGGPIASYLRAIHPDDRAPTEQLIRGAIESGQPYEARYRVRGAGGEYRTVVARGKAEYGPGGAPTRLPGVVVDVSQQEKAEQALRRLAADLSEAGRQKDEFLATLAHELRNPLAPIRNGLQVIRLSPDRATRAGALEMMERQLGQLVRLVDDLLDVTRVTTGKVTLRPERVTVRSLLAAAVEANRPLVEQAGHELAVRLPERPVVVDADPTRLTQVFTNLLNNAAKYTPAGGRIEASVAREGGEAVVRVADSGVGIPAELLPKVFDMFVQVGQSLDRSQGGLGIGLTLVRKLVEMHGGTVAAESPGEGRGSTFVVRLPAAEESPNAPPRDAPPGATAPPPGRRVLVVDDNRDAADSLTMLLELQGYEVRTAYTGPTGLDAAREFRPDVALLDIGLPGMNGYEVAGQLRRDRAAGGLFLAALTGWGSDGDRKRAAEAGFDAHLTKPVELAALQGLMAEIARQSPHG